MNKIINRFKNMNKREKLNLTFLIIIPLCYIVILFFGYVYMDNIKNSLSAKIETINILSKETTNNENQESNEEGDTFENSSLDESVETEDGLNDEIIKETIEVSALSIRAGVENDPNIRDAEIYLPDGEKIEVPKNYEIITSKDNVLENNNQEKNKENIENIDQENEVKDEVLNQEKTNDEEDIKKITDDNEDKEIVEEDKKINYSETIEYTVRTGDTLFNIGKRFLKITKGYKQIQKINNLGESTSISVGQKLKIPVIKINSQKNAFVYGGNYETLIEIYGDSILDVNRLKKEQLVKGLVLAIP